jgi:xylan 1,4-beta-xylosidase
VLISNYHDSDRPGPPALIDLTISGLPQARMLVSHFRVDDDHSNAYEAWKKLGSPQKPAPDQYAQLEAAGQLHSMESPRWDTAQGGRIHMAFPLPLHGVSLIRLTW